jgi:hypothetical protein
MAGENIVTVDDRELKAAIRDLKKIPRAMSRMPRIVRTALNQTSSSAKKKSAAELAGKVKLSVGAIKKNIRQVRATYTLWRSSLDYHNARVPLIKFGARKGKTGVSYQIDPKSGRKTMKHVFIQTMPSGHKGVYGRQGADRFPLYEVMGPSVAGIMDRAIEVLTRVTNEAGGELEHNIEVQTKKILDKLTRKAS